MATIPLGLYLWERIHQCGIDHIFGVPGDFNLNLLDHVYNVDGLEWVGNTNELNAAYAADGYARARSNAGCLITTHGVGELSALNGIAGAMTEQVKVVHVVGQTSRQMQQNKMMIHHSIGFAPDHQIFNKASAGFRCAAAELQSEDGATEEIDRVLREMFIQSKPVYIFFPIDLVDKEVSADALKKPLNLEPSVNEESLQGACSHVLDALYASKSPAIFVDCLVQRHDAVAEIRDLVDKLGIRVFTSNMGKGIIDETHPSYVGLYNGLPTGAGVPEAMQESDLVLVVGNLPSDTNSGGFTRDIPSKHTIAIDTHSVTTQNAARTYSDVPIKAVLRKLLESVDASKIPKAKMPTLSPRPTEDDADSKLITQSWVWHRLAASMQAHDVVFGETGTAAFGLPDATFPPNTTWITQTYYGSIGYATPASFGVEVALNAARKSSASKNGTTTNGTSSPGAAGGRTVLVTGDGSLMLTVQEIGNFIKHSLSPLIIIINNGGYTIERVIHGAKQSYNDIVPFDYEHMLPFFNLGEEQAKGCFHRATTKAELEAILEKEEVKNPMGKALPQVVEIVMDAMDVPWRLSTQIAVRGEAAVKEMEEAGFKVRVMGKGKGFWH